MQAFGLVADASQCRADGSILRASWPAISGFFPTPEQPNKPARAVVEVSALIRPGWRVEIEAQAARMPGQ
ncbi:MAG: hypothetical protein R3C13_00360 [Hyphomonas sp.]